MRASEIAAASRGCRFASRPARVFSGLRMRAGPIETPHPGGGGLVRPPTSPSPERDYLWAAERIAVPCRTAGATCVALGTPTDDFRPDPSAEAEMPRPSECWGQEQPVGARLRAGQEPEKGAPSSL